MECQDKIKATMDHSVEELNTVIMVLQGLYEQMNEERKVITLASGQMAHSVKQFEAHLAQFDAFEKACKTAVVERVRTELNQNIRVSAQAIAHEVTDRVYEPINRGINSLCQLSTEMAEHRSQQKNAWPWGAGLFLSAALTGGLVSGFFVHYLASPSKEIKVQLAAGAMLMRSWGQLSQAEKDKIIKN